ncbi:MAG: hypothetical protein N2255_02625 [Kiritimatiellae bacterium]|nr:hypothetical protein [Kiritimatiellia bacterium]
MTTGIKVIFGNTTFIVIKISRIKAYTWEILMKLPRGKSLYCAYYDPVHKVFITPPFPLNPLGC